MLEKFKSVESRFFLVRKYFWIGGWRNIFVPNVWRKRWTQFDNLHILLKWKWHTKEPLDLYRSLFCVVEWYVLKFGGNKQFHSSMFTIYLFTVYLLIVFNFSTQFTIIEPTSLTFWMLRCFQHVFFFFRKKKQYQTTTIFSHISRVKCTYLELVFQYGVLWVFRKRWKTTHQTKGRFGCLPRPLPPGSIACRSPLGRLRVFVAAGHLLSATGGSHLGKFLRRSATGFCCGWGGILLSGEKKGTFCNCMFVYCTWMYFVN